MLECNRAVLETLDASNEGTIDSESKLIGRVVIEKGAEIIRSTVSGPAIIGKNTKLIDTYVGPYTSIYNDCLLEKNEIELTKESVDIHHVIQSAVDHLQLIANERDAKVSLNLQAQRSFSSINEDHMTNVIINLIDNALKYSPNQPIINISTVNDNNEIVIKVSDNGIGMSKAVQKRVFEKFYREHTGDIHNVKGHGLGLAYVQKIIDEHDGKVFVDSEKDKGSTFTIRLNVLSF
jgi:signal transduction histidine kinase